jgi:hypothetical protein
MIYIHNLNTWRKVKREGYERLDAFLEREESTGTTEAELCDGR